MRKTDFIPLAIIAIFALLLLAETKFERWRLKRKADREFYEVLKQADAMMAPENRLYMSWEGDHMIATNLSGARLRMDIPTNWDGRTAFIGQLKQDTNK